MVNQEKRWDWKHMLYDEMRNWAMWNCTNEWYEKKEMIDMKKDAQMGKNVMRKMKNGLPIINLPI